MRDYDDISGTFNRCKSIDEIYDEVRNCDLVITNDVALATALNARLDRLFVGRFAMTPREIASKNAIGILGRNPLSDTELVRSVSEETGFDPTFVHGEIENFRETRRYLENVRKYLDRDSTKIYDSYVRHPTVERAMETIDITACDDFLKCSRIAVIDAPLFDQLDRRLNPSGMGICDVVEVDSATNDPYSIDEIHMVGSDRQIANNVIDLIDAERATDYAIVVNSEGPMVNALKISLYRKKVSFVNELEPRDMDPIRRFMEFLHLSLDYDTIRVEDVRGIFITLGANINPRYNRHLLRRMDGDRLNAMGQKIRDVMGSIRDRTFSEVKGMFFRRREDMMISDILDELDIGESLVTTKLLTYMGYMVNNVNGLRFEDERPESERKGVLIADCNRSCHIDRPIVFYLGMEQDWNYNMPGKRYMEFDRRLEESKNAYRMQTLLQQGQVRKYFVNMNKNGDAARPSSVFDHFFEEPVDSFEDICGGNIIRGSWTDDQIGVGPSKDDSLRHRAKGFEVNFSKSSYSNYLRCPYRFELGKLLSSEEKDVTEMGNLIHNFAELYACYPDLVNEMGLERLEEDILDKYSGLSYPALSDVDRSEIHVNLLNTKAFLDGLEVRMSLDTPIDPESESNKLLLKYGLKMKSSDCEREVIDDANHLFGKMDLVWNGTIYDFKTGKAKTASEYLAYIKKYRDQQAYLYLVLSAKLSDYTGRFVLVYTAAKDKDAISGKIDLRNNTLEVIIGDDDPRTLFIKTYLRKTMEDSQYRLSDPEILGEFYDRTVKKIDGHPKPNNVQFDKDLAKGLIESNDENDYLKKVVFNSIKNSRIYGPVTADNRIIVPKELIDMALEELAINYDKMRMESDTEFPINQDANCKDCDYRIFCTREISDIEGGEETYE